MLGELVRAEGYDDENTRYLVNRLRDGFKLRLDKTT